MSFDVPFTYAHYLLESETLERGLHIITREINNEGSVTGSSL